MKYFTTFAIAATFALGACTTDEDVSASTSPAPAATKTVVDPLIGKRLVAGDVTFIINADGSMGGTFRGEPIVGVYKANAKESCSRYSAPKNLTGQEFCSTPVIKDDTVIFHRRDGSKSQVYTIQG